jgi:hypothetical protein
VLSSWAKGNCDAGGRKAIRVLFIMETNKELPIPCRMQREFCDLRFKNLDEKLDDMCRKIDTLVDCVKGNGKIGLVIRTDRLEQARKRHVKLIWVLVGSVAAILANLVGHYLGI